MYNCTILPNLYFFSLWLDNLFFVKSYFQYSIIVGRLGSFNIGILGQYYSFMIFSLRIVGVIVCYNPNRPIKSIYVYIVFLCTCMVIWQLIESRLFDYPPSLLFCGLSLMMLPSLENNILTILYFINLWTVPMLRDIPITLILQD